MSRDNSVAYLIENWSFRDERGSVGHLFKKSTNNMLIREVYFSSVMPGITKGWKFHENKNQLFSTVKGKLEFIIGSRDKATNKIVSQKTFILDEKDDLSLFIPQKSWYAFRSIVLSESKLLNLTDCENSESISHNIDYEGE